MKQSFLLGSGKSFKGFPVILTHSQVWEPLSQCTIALGFLKIPGLGTCQLELGVLGTHLEAPLSLLRRL